jgi:hypothetical protein
MARPTKYSQEIVDQSWEYVNGEWETSSSTVPSVVGLCRYINRSKSIIYDWAKDEEKEFSDILSALMELQEDLLREKGLLKEFDSGLTKMFLTKHGYSDKQEVTQTTTHTFTQLSDEELERIVSSEN